MGVDLEDSICSFGRVGESDGLDVVISIFDFTGKT